jgi:glycosyltransferase involved in cell wall biosynthesis
MPQQEISNLARKTSLGIFLSRPDRSFYMARELRERGFDVVNYNSRGYNGGPHVKVGGRFPSALTHLLLRTDHDVYFAGLSFTPSFCLYLNRRLRKKPYVFNLTGASWECFDDRSAGKPFGKFFETQFYPFLMSCVLAGASRIVCNSRFLELAVAARYPQYAGRLVTIYNGIELDKYRGAGPRTPCQINKPDVTLLYVTTLNYGNKSRGLELVVDAFGEVLTQRKKTRLVIAAKVSHPRYSEWARELVQARPWRDSVTLLFNHTDVPGLLAASDIFVFATPHNSNDSLPRVLLEAQSAGLPAVTTNTTGCAEVVRDGITGFVVPYDAKAFADKVLSLIESPELRAEMSHEARRWIAETFNWDQMADRYASVFREVLGQRSEVGDLRPHFSRIQ